jgi:kinesin family protein 4/21/27
MSAESVRVAIRARPLVGHEREAGACSITNKLSKTELVLGSDRVFSYNHVFGPEDEQELVFDEAVSAQRQLRRVVLR